MRKMFVRFSLSRDELMKVHQEAWREGLTPDDWCRNKIQQKLAGIEKQSGKGASLDETLNGEFGVPNTVVKFLREACETGGDCHVAVMDLWQSFEKWRVLNNIEYPRTPASFGRVMRSQIPGLKWGVERDPETYKIRRYYIGLRLKQKEQENDTGTTDISTEPAVI